MAEATNVWIVNRIDIGGGLLTVIVSGDVGSVCAAVEADAPVPVKWVNWLSSQGALESAKASRGQVVVASRPGRNAQWKGCRLP
jgi:hypothetical protein